MLVFKFGGASVKDAQGINNLVSILKQYGNQKLFVVVSAMGKTTNGLEAVHAAYYEGDKSKLLAALQAIKDYHYDILRQLECRTNIIDKEFERLENIITADVDTDFDRSYDKIVSFGELLSTTIVSAYLSKQGIANKWLDMSHILITDNHHREANVLMNESAERLHAILADSEVNIHIAQGFIGGTLNGEPATLGREGSDYTAAVVANMIDAGSVTIWKDVPGVMSADPKLYADAVHIPELTYYDAVELAYSGAQIIHPKTIRPLQNKGIPLFVKPFLDPQASGSVIKARVSKPIDVPVYILRKNQVLITVRPLDFAFVLEESLSDIFLLIRKYNLKVSLIQSSAVTISVCVDNSRILDDALHELNTNYRVTYNEGLCLLTVRGTTPAIIESVSQGKDILLKQTTRRTIKLVYRE